MPPGCDLLMGNSVSFPRPAPCEKGPYSVRLLESSLTAAESQEGVPRPSWGPMFNSHGQQYWLVSLTTFSGGRGVAYSTESGGQGRDRSQELGWGAEAASVPALGHLDPGAQHPHPQPRLQRLVVPDLRSLPGGDPSPVIG